MKNFFIKEPELIQRYENNLTCFESKHIQSIGWPESLEDLKTIVLEAHKNRTKLYPISTGKNWGLGSKQPVTENNVVVSLEKMNRIIEVNAHFRYAIIEPGVTQKQLSDYLLIHHPNLKFPVTGSSEETSVTGNLLERGVSFFGHKNNTLLASEILLSDGTLLKTGFWNYFNNNHVSAFNYPYGHGPDLRGLFTQSNLGITTKLVIRLQPKRRGHIMLMYFKERHLKKITNLLRIQHEEKLLDEGIVISNLNDPRASTKGSFEYDGHWLALAPLSGTKELLNTKKRILSRAYAKLPIEFLFISTYNNPFGFRKHTLYPFIINSIQKYSHLKKTLNPIKTKSGKTLGELYKGFELLKNYYNGIPSNYSIQTMAEMNGTDLKNEELDNSNALGFSVVLPAVPMNGSSVMEVYTIIEEVSKKWKVHPFHNFASVDELTFEGFHRVYFDRNNPKAIETAHNWNNDVHSKLEEKGYLPYRINNEQMKRFTNKPNNAYWATIGKLKKCLDEHNILSNNRYCP